MRNFSADGHQVERAAFDAKLEKLALAVWNTDSEKASGELRTNMPARSCVGVSEVTRLVEI